MVNTNPEGMVDRVLRWAAVPSPTGHEQDILELVEHDLRDLGWDQRRIPVDGSRHDILAGPPEGRMLFTTHLDVVPPHIAPRRRGKMLFGRGVADAKGAAACLLEAACRLRRTTDRVSLLFVVGEECDSDGARAAVSAGLRFNYVLNGEPTGNVFASFQKGTLRATLRTAGIACHSGYPEHGVSAIERLMDVLDDVRRTPWPSTPCRGATTVNIGSIEGGVADNVLAPEASARLMFRTVGPCEEVSTQLTELVGGRAGVHLGKASPPLELFVPPHHPSAPVAFGSDLPYLRGIGVPMMVGPGSILTAHGAHERVTIEDLVRAVALYTDVGTRLLQGDP